METDKEKTQKEINNLLERRLKKLGELRNKKDDKKEIMSDIKEIESELSAIDDLFQEKLLKLNN